MIQQLLFSVVPPGVVGLLVALLLWRCRSGEAFLHWKVGAGAAVFAISFFAVNQFTIGRTPIVPSSASEWAAWFGVLALPSALTASVRSIPTVVLWIVRVATLLVIGWVSARSQMHDAWTPTKSASTLSIFVLGSALVLLSSEVLLARRPGVASVLAIVTMISGSAAVLVLAFYSLKLAQSTGIAAALVGGVLAGVAAAQVLRTDITVARGALDVPIFIAMGLLLHGWLFGDAEHPTAMSAAIVASPIAACLASFALSSRWRGWRGELAVAAAACVPIVAAVTYSVATRPADSYS